MHGGSRLQRFTVLCALVTTWIATLGSGDAGTSDANATPWAPDQVEQRPANGPAMTEPPRPVPNASTARRTFETRALRATAPGVARDQTQAANDPLLLVPSLNVQYYSAPL